MHQDLFCAMPVPGSREEPNQVSIKRACLRHSQGVVLRVRTVLLLQGVGQFPGEAVKVESALDERLLQSDGAPNSYQPGLSRGLVASRRHSSLL